MATDIDDLKEYSKTNDDTLHLCFPLPPSQYFKKYSDQNVNNGKSPSPPKVVCDTYSVFGDLCDKDEGIIRPLEVQGIPQLFSTKDDYDVLAEMKKINHSILVNFMELLDTMIDSSSQHERELKLEDMNLLFINLHHLINEFRPHQARETLRVMLHRQKVQKYETAEKLIRHIEKAKAVIRNCQTNLPNKSSSNGNILERQSNITKTTEVTMDTQKCERNPELDASRMCDLVDNIT